MPEDEDRGDNRTDDMKLDAELLKILESYAELDQDSAKLNKKRADLRAQAERPLSQRLHKGGCAYTVEAEKGGAMRQPQPSHAA